MNATKTRTPRVETEPAAAVETPLPIQLASLSGEICGLETEIEGIVRIIRGTPGRIAAAKADYDDAFLKSDTATMTAAQDRILAANQERAAALTRLHDFAEPLAELKIKQAGLWQQILDASIQAAAAYERARTEVAAVGRLLDASGSMGGRLSAIQNLAAVTA